MTLVGRAGTERLTVLDYRQEGIYYSILTVCVCLYIFQSKQEGKGRVDLALPLLIPQILDRE